MPKYVCEIRKPLLVDGLELAETGSRYGHLKGDKQPASCRRRSAGERSCEGHLLADVVRHRRHDLPRLDQERGHVLNLPTTKWMLGWASEFAPCQVERRAADGGADSDDLARVFRFDLAQDSEMISPRGGRRSGCLVSGIGEAAGSILNRGMKGRFSAPVRAVGMWATPFALSKRGGMSTAPLAQAFRLGFGFAACMLSPFRPT
ncbi:hypothetical protein [Bradyrhizobium elkanii]|uniref:hypothetical protein n=1 Tax=Bradyrhizobium elkanii TaxID=29448 RepID=UPI000A988938|nr:hypothetical protein [Bradyrhizobium elkanii]